MIVVDTSAWVELFRSTESETHVALRDLLEARANLAVTEIVVMELLGRTPRNRAALRKRLLSYTLLPLNGLQDFEAAATIFRRCRMGGEPVRGYTDCLIAVPVIREKAKLLHCDHHFEKIARHSDLELAL